MTSDLELQIHNWNIPCKSIISKEKKKNIEQVYEL